MRFECFIFLRKRGLSERDTDKKRSFNTEKSKKFKASQRSFLVKYKFYLASINLLAVNSKSRYPLQ